MLPNGGQPGSQDPASTTSHSVSPGSGAILPLYGNGLGVSQSPTKQSVTLTRKRPSARWRHSSGHFHSKSTDQHGPFSSSGTWSSLFASRNSPLAVLRPSYLTARARTTNLAVLLLLLTLALSLLYNIRFYLHEHPLSGEKDRLPLSIRATLPQINRLAVSDQGQRHIPGDTRQAAEGEGAKAAARAPSTDNIDLSKLDHLIVVAGHAVWRGRTREEAVQDENWILEEVQKGGSVQTFVKHIMKGVEVAVADPSSLLVFSGGQTRTAAQEAEGDSYFRLAEALDLYRQFSTPKTPAQISDSGKDDTVGNDRKPPEMLNVDKAVKGSTSGAPSAKKKAEDVIQAKPPFARATTEQFALDSYQNLIFSLCRFKEVTGRYPSRITVVGFGMKRSRFTDVHRAAIKWPLDSFTYIGIDDVGETGQSYRGEKEFGLKPFMEDHYGCKGFLLSKRRNRNPFRRIHPYFTSNPLLRDLLEFCPTDGVATFPKTLPWEGQA